VTKPIIHNITITYTYFGRWGLVNEPRPDQEPHPGDAAVIEEDQLEEGEF
jgi:hypothetical protein